jgi:pyruvate formate lyase activating enzyme
VIDTRKRGISLLPRIPLVPGITDTDSNILAISSFLKEWGVLKADILPYNPLWHDKSWSLGRKDGYSEDKDMTEFLSQEKIRHCKAIILAAGIDV